MTEEPSKHIAELDESDPSTWQVPADCVRVMFQNEGRRALDEGRLAAALGAADWPRRVQEFGIYPTSSLTNLRILEFFPGLKRIGVAGKQIRDFSDLARFPKLVNLGIGDQKGPRDLSVLRQLSVEEMGLTVRTEQDLEQLGAMQAVRFLGIDWPFEDFTQFRGPVSERLHVTSGRPKSFRGLQHDYRGVEVFNCRQLQDLAGLSTKLLRFYGCWKVEFATLSGVKNLKFLRIGGQPGMDTFQAIPELPSLVELNTEGVRNLPQDIEPLVQSPSLRRVHFSHPIRNDYIERIGSRSPRFIISNGRSAWFRGKRVDPQEYYRIPLDGDFP